MGGALCGRAVAQQGSGRKRAGQGVDEDTDLQQGVVGGGRGRLGKDLYRLVEHATEATAGNGWRRAAESGPEGVLAPAGAGQAVGEVALLVGGEPRPGAVVMQQAGGG